MPEPRRPGPVLVQDRRQLGFSLGAVDQRVARVRNRVTALTREHLQACLPISETTWAKLRDGRPIKHSTFERLIARLG